MQLRWDIKVRSTLQAEKKTIHAGYHKRAIFNQTKPRVHVPLAVLISAYRQSERIEHLSQKNIKRLRSFERTRLFIHENFSCFIERFHPKSRSELIARPLVLVASDISLKLRIPSTFMRLFYRLRYMSDYVYTYNIKLRFYFNY